jgi:hypothetical protein
MFVISDTLTGRGTVCWAAGREDVCTRILRLMKISESSNFQMTMTNGHPLCSLHAECFSSAAPTASFASPLSHLWQTGLDARYKPLVVTGRTEQSWPVVCVTKPVRLKRTSHQFDKFHCIYQTAVFWLICHFCITPNISEGIIKTLQERDVRKFYKTRFHSHRTCGIFLVRLCLRQLGWRAAWTP